MGSPSYMRSVVDRNVVMRLIPVDVYWSFVRTCRLPLQAFCSLVEGCRHFAGTSIFIFEHKVVWYVITERMPEHAASLFRMKKEAECSFEKFVNIALLAVSQKTASYVLTVTYLCYSHSQCTYIFTKVITNQHKCMSTFRSFNLLKPNDIYICRNAALTSRSYILNIYSTNIHTENFKHAA